MTTIIAPTTVSSDLINGLFFNGTKFVNRFKSELTNKIACFMVWSYNNSKFGQVVADARLTSFQKQYGIAEANVWDIKD